MLIFTCHCRGEIKDCQNEDKVRDCEHLRKKLFTNSTLHGPENFILHSKPSRKLKCSQRVHLNH